MFDKNKSKTDEKDSSIVVFRPPKGSSKVIIGNGVKLQGELTKADEG